jgi:DNA-directed RNA polymerase specialized sigma24 family protein
VQNIFLEIYQNPGKFDPSRGTLKVWLLQYAYTRSINRRHYLERRQFYSSVEVENIPPLAVAIGSTDGRHLAPAETVRLIREVLGMLNEGQQGAIRMVYFEGLTFSEAALKTGETPHIVRHNYYRGLMKLRELIRAKGASEEAIEKPEARGTGGEKSQATNHLRNSALSRPRAKSPPLSGRSLPGISPSARPVVAYSPRWKKSTRTRILRGSSLSQRKIRTPVWLFEKAFCGEPPKQVRTFRMRRRMRLNVRCGELVCGFPGTHCGPL